MKNNRSLQILVPFIVNKIEKSYDAVDENSSVKKNLYLMVIDSLNNNKYVNLEYHVAPGADLETHLVQDLSLFHHICQGVRSEEPHR
jgi:hypothetical protein